MNQIQLWRLLRKRYTIEEAAQALDTSPAEYELIEAGTARANLPGVRALESELHKPYALLKRHIKR